MNNLHGGNSSTLIILKKLEDLESEIKSISSNLNRNFETIDLDTIKHTCSGYCTSCINAPVATNGFLEVITNRYSTIVMQRYTQYNTFDMYIRYCLNGKWGNWLKK